MILAFRVGPSQAARVPWSQPTFGPVRHTVTQHMFAEYTQAQLSAKGHRHWSHPQEADGLWETRANAERALSHPRAE